MNKYEIYCLQTGYDCYLQSGTTIEADSPEGALKNYRGADVGQKWIVVQVEPKAFGDKSAWIIEINRPEIEYKIVK